MRSAAAAWKILRVLLHGLAGLATIVFLFPRLETGQRNVRVQAWAAKTLRILGIALEVQGQPVRQGPVLLVANHISWLDIVVLHAARHCRFVSKADVRHWPLIGRLATGAGTLYIERESRRDAMRVVHHMAESLRDGDVLAIFPEGTTSDGRGVLPFHANLFQAAISADAPVQPVAVSFLDARSGAFTDAAAYVGDDTLVGSLWRTLCAPPMRVRVGYGGLDHAQGRDRRSWAGDLREQLIKLRSS